MMISITRNRYALTLLLVALQTSSKNKGDHTLFHYHGVIYQLKSLDDELIHHLTPK